MGEVAGGLQRDPETSGAQNSTASYAVLWAVVAGLTLGLLLASQTVAAYGDEGFHLLAARLINFGKKPYVDFLYTNPPLYAFANAGWMRVFGQSWRSAHAFSALLTGGCILLVADFVFRRLRGTGWGLAGAIAASLLVGLHLLVVQFGTIGQTYGLCLFLITAGFRIAVKAVERQGEIGRASCRERV